jgi:hypothetical protein
MESAESCFVCLHPHYALITAVQHQHQLLQSHIVTFPSHVTSASSGIEKGKWLEWRDAPSRTDSSGSNGPVEPELVLDAEETLILARLIRADVIEHEDDHAPDYGAYGVISGRLALS